MPKSLTQQLDPVKGGRSVIANDPMVTENGLRAWLADPHPPMPKFDLTRIEIDAIIDYITSLKRD